MVERARPARPSQWSVRLSESDPIGEAEPARWADPAPTYDRVASVYAERFRDELDGKPFDRELLRRFAAKVATTPDSIICDVGCGPGHVGAFLADLGQRVFGIDRSAGMVAQARSDHPTVAFVQGDMTSLALLDEAVEAVVCFYALIHILRTQVLHTLRELRRVVGAGGAVLVAVHGGEGVLHVDEMVGQQADLDVTLFSLTELSELLEEAGLSVEEAHERAPYGDEHPTLRLYVWASRRT
jgi:SAM-dependent methyltransferase